MKHANNKEQRWTQRTDTLKKCILQGKIRLTGNIKNDQR